MFSPYMGINEKGGEDTGPVCSFVTVENTNSEGERDVAGMILIDFFFFNRRAMDSTSKEYGQS